MKDIPRHMNAGRTSKPLKICIIYSRSPFPMMRGDQLTISHLLQFLHERGHKVDFFTLKNDGEISLEQEEWINEKCENVYLIKYSIFDKLRNLFVGLFRLLPLQVALFNSFRQKKMVLDSEGNSPYDIVYSYYIRSAEAGKIFKDKNFLAMQLSQFLNTKRIRDNSRNLFVRIVYSIELFLIKRYELKIADNFSMIGIIGEKDLESINEIRKSSKRGPLSNYIFSAHGTDITKFRPVDENEKEKGRIVFSGNMSYEPNIQAALWFMKNCWDQILLECPTAELYIVGKNPAGSLVKMNGTNRIVVTGTVDDPFEYIRKAEVCINPVLAAGGMQNKLIEYMASGKVVVSTSVANEGIGAPSNSIILADNAAEFIKGVVAVLKSSSDFLNFGREARKFVEDNWTWKSHFLKLEKEFIKIAKK